MTEPRDPRAANRGRRMGRAACRLAVGSRGDARYVAPMPAGGGGDAQDAGIRKGDFAMTLLGDQLLVAKVKALRKEGKTQNEIAVEVGVTQGTISVILRQSGLGGHLTPTRRVKGAVG